MERITCISGSLNGFPSIAGQLLSNMLLPTTGAAAPLADTATQDDTFKSPRSRHY
jgi:hypothetical protein